MSVYSKARNIARDGHLLLCLTADESVTPIGDAQRMAAGLRSAVAGVCKGQVVDSRYLGVGEVRG